METEPALADKAMATLSQQGFVTFPKIFFPIPTKAPANFFSAITPDSPSQLVLGFIRTASLRHKKRKCLSSAPLTVSP
jgi:hypothetical protein